MNVRKIITYIDEVLTEGGRPVDPPARTAVVVAVIENPWAGQGFVEDLGPGIDGTASDLGKLLTPRVVEALGVPVEAFGKAAIVGLDGEIEHGSALIHTLKFGDHFRKATDATTLLPAVEKRQLPARCSTCRSSTSPTPPSAHTTRASRCGWPMPRTPTRSSWDWPPLGRVARRHGSRRSPPSSDRPLRCLAPHRHRHRSRRRAPARRRARPRHVGPLPARARSGVSGDHGGSPRPRRLPRGSARHLARRPGCRCRRPPRGDRRRAGPPRRVLARRSGGAVRRRHSTGSGCDPVPGQQRGAANTSRTPGGSGSPGGRTQRPAATVEVAVSRWFDAPWRHREPELVATVRRTMLANDPSSYLACYTVFADGDTQVGPLVGQITAPDTRDHRQRRPRLHARDGIPPGRGDPGRSRRGRRGGTPPAAPGAPRELTQALTKHFERTKP